MAALCHLPEAPPPRPTIREVADAAGVSIATVSRVLNERGDVAPDTRELVSRVIREFGYTANRSARNLSAGRAGLVGVLVPLVYPAYFAEMLLGAADVGAARPLVSPPHCAESLSGAAEALNEQDLRLVLSPTDHQHDREVSL